MNNLLMPLIGADIYAIATAVIGLGLLGTAAFLAVRKLVWLIQGKPVKRFVIRRRTKGKHRIKEHEEVFEDKTPTPTPEPLPLPEPTPEEVVEEIPQWPRCLKRIRIKANMKGGKWNKGEFKDAEDDSTMFRKLNEFLVENLENDNVTSLEFTFADPIGSHSNNFIEFKVRRGPKRPKCVRPERAKEIMQLITDIETYSMENDGVFTEDVCKAFEQRAEELNATVRTVKVNSEEVAKNASFIEDDRHASQMEAYQKLRQQLAKETSAEQSLEEEKTK